MNTTTATREVAARTGVSPSRPRVGLLGIMQGLYDDMLPGISRAPGGVRRARSAQRSPASPTSTSRPPVKDRDGHRARRARRSSTTASTACSW